MLISYIWTVDTRLERLPYIHGEIIGNSSWPHTYTLISNHVTNNNRHKSRFVNKCRANCGVIGSAAPRLLDRRSFILDAVIAHPDEDNCEDAGMIATSRRVNSETGR